MTPQQKTILRNSISFYKKQGEKEQGFCKNSVKSHLKTFPDHENALPAKIFLRICKNL